MPLMHYLIIGVDPGHTIGLAALDLSGKPLKAIHIQQGGFGAALAGALAVALWLTGLVFGGSFTATGVNGTYQVVAMWKNDVRYTATTSLRCDSTSRPAAWTSPSVCRRRASDDSSSSVSIGIRLTAVM